MRTIHLSRAILGVALAGITLFGLPFGPSRLQAQETKRWDHLDLSHAKVKGDFVRINPDKAIATKKAHSGPVEITVVARTDQDNIRLWAYQGGVVIFNWEVMPGELRIHRPDDLAKGQVGSVAVSKQVPLKPDTWYTLRWKITDDWMEVAVNDRVVFAEQRTFDLSKAVPVKVSGAFGSVVDVKAFEVKPLPGRSHLFKEMAQARRLVWTPDEDRLVVAGDKGIALWDLKQRKVVRRITDKGVGKGHFAVTSDGKQVLLTNEDETTAWDVATGKQVRTSAKVASRGVSQFSPDGKYAALLGRTHITVVNLEKDSTVLEVPSGSPDPWNFRFAPDGKRLLLFGGSYEKYGIDMYKAGKGEIKEIDLGSGKEVRSYAGQGGPVFGGDYSPDGKLLATAGLETLCIWDVATGKRLHSLSHPPSFCQFTHDGKFVVSYSNNRLTVIVWDATTGKAVLELGRRDGAVAVSRNGKIATVSRDEPRLTVHDMASGKELLSFAYEAEVTGNMTFSPNGKTLVVGMKPGLLVLPVPPLPAEAPVAETGPKKLLAWDTFGADSLPASLGFSPDGQRLVGYAGGTARIWDVATKKAVHTIRADDERVDGSAAFSPDGKQVACEVGAIKVYAADTAKQVTTINGNFRSLAYRPDGKWLATADNADVVCWDLATGKEAKTFRMKGQVYSTAFRHDGKLIAAGGGGVKVWDVESGKLLVNDLNDTFVMRVIFSPDGKYLAAATWGDPKGTVVIWETATGKQVRTMKCSTAQVVDLAFSPDGKRVVSVGMGKCLPDLTAAQVWDTDTGRLLCLLDTGTGERTISVAISPVLSKADETRPFLGATFGEADEGVVVKGVVEDAPAAKAGLKEGDKILTVSGEAVAADSFVKALAKHKLGEKVSLKIRRGEQTLEVQVTLTGTPGGRLVAIGGVGSPIRLFMLPE